MGGQWTQLYLQYEAEAEVIVVSSLWERSDLALVYGPSHLVSPCPFICLSACLRPIVHPHP